VKYFASAVFTITVADSMAKVEAPAYVPAGLIERAFGQEAAPGGPVWRIRALLAIVTSGSAGSYQHLLFCCICPRPYILLVLTIGSSV
jgi:hypothetical protein